MMKGSSIAVDVVAFVVYLLAANPDITGIPVHEWLGLGVIVVIVAHCAMHFDWFAQSARQVIAGRLSKSASRLALDAFTGIVFVTCSVSGLLISGTVLPLLGYYADGYHFWNPLHSFSAKLLLALIIVHVVLHIRQVLAFAKLNKNEKKP